MFSFQRVTFALVTANELADNSGYACKAEQDSELNPKKGGFQFRA